MADKDREENILEEGERKGGRPDNLEAGEAHGSGSGGQIKGSQVMGGAPGAGGDGGSGGQGGGSQGGGGQGNLNG